MCSTRVEGWNEELRSEACVVVAAVLAGVTVATAAAAATVTGGGGGGLDAFAAAAAAAAASVLASMTNAPGGSRNASGRPPRGGDWNVRASTSVESGVSVMFRFVLQRV